MNILTDILSLIRRKKYVDTVKPDDVLVVGIHEEPDMLGIASPVPYKSVKLIKVEDLVVTSQGCIHVNVPDPSSFAGIYKNTTTVGTDCFVNLRRLKSLSPNLTIVENGDFIDIDTTAEANSGINVGGEAEVYKDMLGEVLRFRTLTSSDASITITQNLETIDLVAVGGGGGGEDLAATLVLGNITGGRDIVTSNGDKIAAASGNSFLDLRATGVDDFWFLGNDASGGSFTGPITSIVYGDSTSTNLVFDLVRYGVVVTTDGSTFGTVDPSSPSAYSSILPGRVSSINEATLTLPTDVINGTLTLIQNNSDNRSFRTISGLTVAVSINSGSSGGSGDTVINSGVDNSVAVGGYGLTVKTPNSAYVNQLILQFPANSFDTVLRPSAATADRTISLQDADGTLAFLNDIPGSYAEDLDSVSPSITRTFSAGKTTFEVTHGLNTLDIKPEIFELSTGETVLWTVIRVGVNTVEVSRPGNVADGLYRILI